MKPTLLVLAAGMGSRYGGLKQVDPLGPNGETIIDYSVYDAIQAGFGKVVFVIRKEIEEAFKETFGNKFSHQIEVDYVFQELDNVPAGIQVPADRTKPWGTGHAVLVAKDAIAEPFAMINADDFYGKEAFQLMADFLSARDNEENLFCLIGYKLKNTLSDHGSVNRGECFTDAEGNLTDIQERLKIRRLEDGSVVYEADGTLHPMSEDTITSMNMMGFTPKAFAYLETFFNDFIQAHSHELKSEFYVPTMLSRAIAEKETKVRVIPTDSNWFGVTYREDRQLVVDSFAKLTEEGVYPPKLWEGQPV